MTEKKEEKKYKRAQLHMKVLRARMNKTPLIIAFVISLYAGVFAGIVCEAFAAGFSWFVVLMIFALVPFWVIGGITRPAYRWYKDRIRNEEQQEKSRNDQKQNDSRKQSDSWKQNYSHGQSYSWNRSEGWEKSNSYSGYEQRSGSQHKESDSGSQYNGSHSGSSRRGGVTVEEARRLFGLKGSFTAEELKKAWKREMKKCHPDQNADSANEEAYEERSKRINMAYDLLKGMATS